MQKGFATIEIIFVTLIISILMTLTIPNAARLVDRVALDYETKHLYSDLRYVQATNRLEQVDTAGSGRNDIVAKDFLAIQLKPATRSYQIIRNGDGTLVRDEHYMRRVVSITLNRNLPSNKITFDSIGQSGTSSCTITLTSRFGKSATIVFDSVGRLRGGRADE